MIAVSIVVPVYNSKKYIEQCIQSLISQTLKEIEIVLVDDGSTDGSGQLCDEYAKKDLRIVVIHQVNAGVSAARNAGICASKGQYIGFSDADDISIEDKFEIQYRNICSTNAEVSVIGMTEYYSEKKQRYIYGTGKKYYWTEGDKLPLKYGLNKEFLTMAPYCMIIKADLCKEVLFEEGRHINEDYYFGFMIFAKAKGICYEDICKYLYMQRESSVSHGKFSKKFFDCNYFADKIEKFIIHNVPELSEDARLNTCLTKLKVLKYLLKDSNAYLKFDIEKKQLIKDITDDYGFEYLRKKLSKLRIIDAYFMCKFTWLYSKIIRIYQSCINT